MKYRWLVLLTALAVSTTGCAAAVGLVGMAVDGDDKDDYKHPMHSDNCHCSKCCNH
jgi:hypothetical protein